MNLRNQRLFLATVTLLGVGLLCSLRAASGQEAAADDKKVEKKEDRETLIREQSIYIPYEKLRKVFEKEGRGVFLPYEKFQELWKAARESSKPVADNKPPVGALITEIESEATVAKDVVQVTAKLKIELLAEGWNQIPLRLADAAITKATLDGKPARIALEPGKGYKLLIENAIEGEKKDAEPKQVELVLEYAKAITRVPGQNSVSFQSPQAPVSRWRVRIPEAGVKVNIHPMIAATEVPDQKKPAAGEPKPVAPAETVVLAFVGAAPTVRIDWNPKAEGATGLAAVASVQAEQQVTVGEGVTRTRALLAYAISRAKLAELVIEVPADQKVVNVFDANVRSWSVARADKQQRITVELFEPAKGSQSVTVELEKFVGDKARDTLDVPVIKVIGVGRQQGVVVVRVAQELQAEATKTSGLLQVDAAELLPSLARTKWQFAYRYATVPFELVLGIEKVQPRILVDSLVEANLQPERLKLDLLAVYTIERAGVFRLELDVPAGYEIRQVHGQKAAGAEPVQVDTHHVEGETKTRLVVNLARKAIGRVALAVRLEKELHQADLLTPTGKAVDIPLTIPRIAPGSAEQDSGRLIISAPESLRVNPGKTEGLRGISFKEALQGMESARSGQSSQLSQPSESRPVLAFAFTREPVSLALAAERRKPQVTIGQLLVAQIEDGVIKYRATFFYNILYSGVKSLRIDVPAEVAAGLRNKTAAVREKVIEPAPKDLAEGYVAWSLSGETELIGKGQIDLVWEKKLEKLDIGKGVELAVPRLMPMDADRAWGQIVLAKAETIDIHESGEPKGLRPIDPQHDLMPGASVKAAARAFEFHDDWAFNVTVTRYQMEEVKRTSIERAVVRMVVTRAGQIPVQAIYRMRSARQRLEVKLPGAEGIDFDTEPLRINGRPVTLERGEKGKFFVPLVDPDADKPFVLELRYTVPGDGRQLDLPEFPEEPAVQKVYLCVYLPEELALLDRHGPWTEEFGWRIGGSMRWKPSARRSAPSLISWATEGIQVSGNPTETFQTDGLLYVFSTLRPAPPPGGSLRLKVLDERLLIAVVFGIVMLGGLLLLPAGAPTRAFAVGLLIVVLVLAGVFRPIFARQIIDDVLLLAVFLVLVVWAVQFFGWSLPRRLRAASAPEESPAPPPVVVQVPAELIAEAVSEEPAEAEPVEENEDDADEKGGKTDA